MSKVDFVIIAFPKCGTTSLVDNLNKHSKVNVYYNCGSKESVLFHSGTFHNKEKREEHDKLLVEGKINGEKNPTYIWNTFSLLNIKEYNPNMKVIISIRNPVDYLYSWYHQLYINSKPCGCSNCKKERGEEIEEEQLTKEKENEEKMKTKIEEIRKENDELQKLYEAYEEEDDVDIEFEESDDEEKDDEEKDDEEKDDEEKPEEGKSKEKCHKVPTFKEFYENERNQEQSYFVNHILKAKTIFDDENILYLVQEEYKEDNQRELNKIFKFLGLEEEELEGLTKFEGKRPNGKMDEETKNFLIEEYKEHNENLFKVLGRKIEIWE